MLYQVWVWLLWWRRKHTDADKAPERAGLYGLGAGGGKGGGNSLGNVDVQADLIYPTSLMPIKICSDCETCGFLNHCKGKMVKEITRCVRIMRHAH